MTLQVFAPAAIFGVGQGAAAPVFALQALALGASPGLAGLIVALSGLGMVIGDLPAGRTVARLGERWAVVLGSTLGALGMLACILANSLIVLGAGLLVSGIAAAVWGLARQSYLVAAVPPNDRGRALSALAGSARLGFFIGPFLGAAAVHFIGLSGGLWIQLIATIAAGALMATLPDPSDERTPAADSVFAVVVEHRRLLATLGSGALAMGAARAARNALLPLWAAHIGLSATTTSLIFGVASAVDVLMSYPSGVLMDRFGRSAVAVPSMVLFAVGYLMLPLTGGAITMGMVGIVLGFANGLSNGVIMTIGADVAPPEQRAEFLGAWRLMHDVGMFAGPIVVGLTSAVSVLAVAAAAIAGVSGLGAAAMRRWIIDPVPQFAARAPGLADLEKT
ncbi:MFS transporter [Aldersonia kunmingensis]|uniref:MFS transporter n=1 Tax=Aldersonia kunmingensis TaxID=408066 RepID=UPI00082EE68D|nr:MFS transporter [Aldersonia kunmingensis]